MMDHVKTPETVMPLHRRF